MIATQNKPSSAFEQPQQIKPLQPSHFSVSTKETPKSQGKQGN
jgi:hypothetical protein